jgi:hypothetical protein
MIKYDFNIIKADLKTIQGPKIEDGEALLDEESEWSNEQ